MNDALLAPFKGEEIWAALNTRASLKASGTNGFPVLFYQKYWSIIGTEVTDYCLAILNGEVTLKEINRTHIVLISKVKKPRPGSGRIEGCTIDIRYPKVADMITSTNTVTLRNTNLLYIPSGSQRHDYKDWLAHLISGSDRKSRVLIVISYWCLWFARNQLVCENVRPSISKLKSFILAHIAELKAIVTLHFPSVSSNQVVWSPSAMSITKFNFDAAYISARKSSVSGVIARNSQGLIMATCALSHNMIVDTFLAEAKVCEAVVDLAISLGFQSIQVEGDSLTVIKKLSAPSTYKSIISPVILDIKSKLGSFENITFAHVGRQGNQAAHMLTKEGLQRLLSRFWIEEAPPAVELIALRDLRQ
ncbi:hypothetical protein V6N11_004501 [Hibiscus sabdariffa]|uniref:RNase H type-1 domain-containing protein n=1 Tax=Hibiscus sabdariffa TaxID=183260 RepID=A0ABR2SHC8_9ROSI